MLRRGLAFVEEEPRLDVPLKLLMEQLRKDGDGRLYARMLREVDRVVLTEMLRQTEGNQLRASSIMGIDRKTLRQKLRNLGLAPARSRPGPKKRLASPSLAAFY